jgi:hypothetical protein
MGSSRESVCVTEFNAPKEEDEEDERSCCVTEIVSCGDVRDRNGASMAEMEADIEPVAGPIGVSRGSSRTPVPTATGSNRVR